MEIVYEKPTLKAIHIRNSLSANAKKLKEPNYQPHKTRIK